MSIVATGSKVGKQNALIYTVLCVLVGLYFCYDGWIGEKYQRKNITWPFTAADIKDAPALARALARTADPIAQFITGQFSEPGKKLLAQAATVAAPSGDDLAAALVAELNRALDQSDLYNAQLFRNVKFSPATQALIDTPDLAPRESAIRNRMIIADLWPDYIVAGHWKQGKPTANLMFNRYVGPGICGLAALYFLIGILRIPTMKIEADENNLVVAGGPTIAYADIRSIDKRDFEKSGRFTINYALGDKTRDLQLSTRTYDNLGEILSEIIKRTGAAPADE